MKIAHLILAHTQPRQLERLIERLQHKNFYFFIHIDKKVSLDDFESLLAKDHVYLVSERVKVGWGAFSIVEATINGFREIASSGLEIDYVNLLSGSDYPLKSPEFIHQFFTKNPDKNFMEYQSVNEEWKEAIPRLTKYHLTNYSFPGRHMVQKWVNRLSPSRTMPRNLIAVGRSQWFSITIDAVTYILEYLDKHVEVIPFFKFTWAPDEIIFQTIIYNSALRETLVNNNLRYIDWADGKPSPKVLGSEDFTSLMESDALFARKFDISRHPEILDSLDSVILPRTS